MVPRFGVQCLFSIPKHAIDSGRGGPQLNDPTDLTVGSWTRSVICYLVFGLHMSSHMSGIKAKLY